MLPQTSGIYSITTIQGKVYYGSAINFKERLELHMCLLRHKRHYNKTIQKAYNNYKDHGFIFRIEMECKRKDLLKNEQKYLDMFYSQPQCLNVARFATSPLGKA